MLIFQGLQRFTYRIGNSAPPPPGISIRPPEGRPPGIKARQGLHRRKGYPPTFKGPCRGDERRAGEVFIYTGPGRETGGQRGPGRNPAAHLLLLVFLSAPGQATRGRNHTEDFLHTLDRRKARNRPKPYRRISTLIRRISTLITEESLHLYRRISTLIPKNLYTHPAWKP